MNSPEKKDIASMSNSRRGSISPAEYTEDGTNNRFLELVTSTMKLPKIDVYDAEQVKNRIIEFFGMCAERNMKPGVANISLALGISRKDFTKIANNHPDMANFPLESRIIIQEAHASLNALWEQYMYNGKINPASGIFLGKNDFGYVDVVNHEITTENRPSIETIEGKYTELPE